MNLGVIGLGKMGLAIAQRTLNAGHAVYGFNHSQAAIDAAQKLGVHCVKKASELPNFVDVIWLMVPPTVVDELLEELVPYLDKKHIVIDGGNSFFKDSIRRAQLLYASGISYMDCGTSGGLHGKEYGFSLMIGGDKNVFEQTIPLFDAIAAPGGYAYMGPSGTGHYVKMVHNGIEYALMQAYAEGFHILKDGHFKELDLAAIANVWNHGSIIRSWLLELCSEIFQVDQSLKNISGKVAQTGMGKWTVQEAQAYQIPINLIREAVELRNESEKTGGDYATKIVALLRHKFGGHALSRLSTCEFE